MFKIIICLFISAFALAQNVTDEKGRKQGKWSQNHDNGQLRYEGSFVDGNPSGIFLYYTERGVLKANLEYFNEGKSASARLYHSNGKIQAVGLYQNELKEQLNALDADAEKVDKGQKAAGTRVRKGLLELKKSCDSVRKHILSLRE